MLNFRNFCIASLALSLLVGGLAAQGSAGLFDRFKPKKPTSRKSESNSLRRAQSPQYETMAPRRASLTPKVGAIQQASYSAQQASYSTDTPWYSSGYTTEYSDYNCGPEDKHWWKKKHCRKLCDQTFYCLVPPYCYPCYGHYPTCWSRLQECCQCPQVQYATHPTPTPGRTPAQPPARVAPPPGAPPVPMDTLEPSIETPVEPPVVPADPESPSSSRRGSGRRELNAAPVSSSQSPRSRWTGYIEPPVEEVEEVASVPAESLEEQLAAEDAADETTENADDEGLETETSDEEAVPSLSE